MSHLPPHVPERQFQRLFSEIQAPLIFQTDTADTGEGVFDASYIPAIVVGRGREIEALTHYYEKMLSDPTPTVRTAVLSGDVGAGKSLIAYAVTRNLQQTLSSVLPADSRKSAPISYLAISCRYAQTTSRILTILIHHRAPTAATRGKSLCPTNAGLRGRAHGRAMERSTLPSVTFRGFRTALRETSFWAIPRRFGAPSSRMIFPNAGATFYSFQTFHA